MSNVLMLQKPVRLNGRREIAEVKSIACERCGRPAFGDPHHIKSRGAGGGNNRENQIQLCGDCHRDAQEYKIPQHELVVLVAQREQKTIGQVYGAIGLSIPPEHEMEKDVIPGPKDPFDLMSLDELLQVVIDHKQKTDECQFLQGKALKHAMSRGVKAGYLASQTNISTSQIRVLVKVYEAFPDEGSRVAELSWSHHKIAAYTSDPARWIETAADQGMSTRQLRKAVIDEEGSEEHKKEALKEKEREIERAKSVLKEVRLVIARGGVAARWLNSELRKIIDASAA
ncbi:MAG: HNH endonuclease [Peptococcaceae bacterium]|jgi:hypothetical protein|nr:HNH endonuclease [Peptococcaceae bacterium]